MAVFSTFRMTRRLAVLSALGGTATVTSLVGWLSGFFESVWNSGHEKWDAFNTWLNSPMGVDHLLAGAGALVVPVVLLFILFAILDG